MHIFHFFLSILYNNLQLIYQIFKVRSKYRFQLHLKHIFGKVTVIVMSVNLKKNIGNFVTQRGMKYSVTCFEITTLTLVIFYRIQSYSVKYPNPRGDEYVEQKRKSYKIYVLKRLNKRDQRKSFERTIHSFELFSALS